mmetsp:Transcript_59584/g.184894  ORF Transcript_59584/g.184894 Transcript_59584/m.184894 type:complete len:269 (-) Transcript_59584:342-1148(-)
MHRGRHDGRRPLGLHLRGDRLQRGLLGAHPARRGQGRPGRPPLRGLQPPLVPGHLELRTGAPRRPRRRARQLVRLGAERRPAAGGRARARGVAARTGNLLQEVPGASARAGTPLPHLRQLRPAHGSPLPLDQQLRRLPQPQVLHPPWELHGPRLPRGPRELLPGAGLLPGGPDGLRGRLRLAAARAETHRRRCLPRLWCRNCHHRLPAHADDGGPRHAGGQEFHLHRGPVQEHAQPLRPGQRARQPRAGLRCLQPGLVRSRQALTAAL